MRKSACSDVSSFSLTLIQWFRENGRELPWRGTTDPYAIWLSEIILQQTQVKQGWAYWERFMQRWPTVEQLAAATEDEVLREWQGLGYYSRARNLHFAARQIVQMGGFPTTFEGIKSLKGVGDYTAAAIGSIAFGLPVAVVDGNVYRVLARHFGISTPINSTEGKKEFALLAQLLIPVPSGLAQSQPQQVSPSISQLYPPKGETRGASLTSEYNQAIMDFGAIQCTPQSPRCLLCPLQESCVALREGTVDQLPVKTKMLKVKERHLTYIYIRCKGYTAIHRRGEGDIWQGLWEPVLIENGKWIMENGKWIIEKGSASHLENGPAQAPPLLQASPLTFIPPRGERGGLQLIKKSVRHVLTHRILLADFYLLQTDERPPLPEGYLWIKEEDIDHYALPRLVEKLVSEVRR